MWLTRVMASVLMDDGGGTANPHLHGQGPPPTSHETPTHHGDGRASLGHVGGADQPNEARLHSHRFPVHAAIGDEDEEGGYGSKNRPYLPSSDDQTGPSAAPPLFSSSSTSSFEYTSSSLPPPSSSFVPSHPQQFASSSFLTAHTSQHRGGLASSSFFPSPLLPPSSSLSSSSAGAQGSYLSSSLYRQTSKEEDSYPATLPSDTALNNDDPSGGESLWRGRESGIEGEEEEEKRKKKKKINDRMFYEEDELDENHRVAFSPESGWDGDDFLPVGENEEEEEKKEKDIHLFPSETISHQSIHPSGGDHFLSSSLPLNRGGDISHHTESTVHATTPFGQAHAAIINSCPPDHISPVVTASQPLQEGEQERGKSQLHHDNLSRSILSQTAVPQSWEYGHPHSHVNQPPSSRQPPPLASGLEGRKEEGKEEDFWREEEKREGEREEPEESFASSSTPYSLSVEANSYVGSTAVGVRQEHTTSLKSSKNAHTADFSRSSVIHGVEGPFDEGVRTLGAYPSSSRVGGEGGDGFTRHRMSSRQEGEERGEEKEIAVGSRVKEEGRYDLENDIEAGGQEEEDVKDSGDLEGGGAWGDDDTFDFDAMGVTEDLPASTVPISHEGESGESFHDNPHSSSSLIVSSSSPLPSQQPPQSSLLPPVSSSRGAGDAGPLEAGGGESSEVIKGSEETSIREQHVRQNTGGETVDTNAIGPDMASSSFSGVRTPEKQVIHPGGEVIGPDPPLSQDITSVLHRGNNDVSIPSKESFSHDSSSSIYSTSTEKLPVIPSQEDPNTVSFSNLEEMHPSIGNNVLPSTHVTSLPSSHPPPSSVPFPTSGLEKGIATLSNDTPPRSSILDEKLIPQHSSSVIPSVTVSSSYDSHPVASSISPPLPSHTTPHAKTSSSSSDPYLSSFPHHPHISSHSHLLSSNVPTSPFGEEEEEERGRSPFSSSEDGDVHAGRGEASIPEDIHRLSSPSLQSAEDRNHPTHDHNNSEGSHAMSLSSYSHSLHEVPPPRSPPHDSSGVTYPSPTTSHDQAMDLPEQKKEEGGDLSGQEVKGLTPSLYKRDRGDRSTAVHSSSLLPTSEKLQNMIEEAEEKGYHGQVYDVEAGTSLSVSSASSLPVKDSEASTYGLHAPLALKSQNLPQREQEESEGDSDNRTGGVYIQRGEEEEEKIATTNPPSSEICLPQNEIFLAGIEERNLDPVMEREEILLGCNSSADHNHTGDANVMLSIHSASVVVVEESTKGFASNSDESMAVSPGDGTNASEEKEKEEKNPLLLGAFLIPERASLAGKGSSDPHSGIGGGHACLHVRIATTGNEDVDSEKGNEEENGEKENSEKKEKGKEEEEQIPAGWDFDNDVDYFNDSFGFQPSSFGGEGEPFYSKDEQMTNDKRAHEEDRKDLIKDVKIEESERDSSQRAPQTFNLDLDSGGIGGGGRGAEKEESIDEGKHFFQASFPAQGRQLHAPALLSGKIRSMIDGQQQEGDFNDSDKREKREVLCFSLNDEDEEEEKEEEKKQPSENDLDVTSDRSHEEETILHFSPLPRKGSDLELERDPLNLDGWNIDVSLDGDGENKAIGEAKGGEEEEGDKQQEQHTRHSSEEKQIAHTSFSPKGEGSSQIDACLYDMKINQEKTKKKDLAQIFSSPNQDVDDAAPANLLLSMNESSDLPSQFETPAAWDVDFDIEVDSPPLSNPKGESLHTEEEEKKQEEEECAEEVSSLSLIEGRAPSHDGETDQRLPDVEGKALILSSSVDHLSFTPSKKEKEEREDGEIHTHEEEKEKRMRGLCSGASSSSLFTQQEGGQQTETGEIGLQNLPGEEEAKEKKSITMPSEIGERDRATCISDIPQVFASSVKGDDGSCRSYERVEPSMGFSPWNNDDFDFEIDRDEGVSSPDLSRPTERFQERLSLSQQDGHILDHTEKAKVGSIAPQKKKESEMYHSEGEKREEEGPSMENDSRKRSVVVCEEDVKENLVGEMEIDEEEKKQGKEEEKGRGEEEEEEGISLEDRWNDLDSPHFGPDFDHEAEGVGLSQTSSPMKKKEGAEDRSLGCDIEKNKDVLRQELERDLEEEMCSWVTSQQEKERQHKRSIVDATSMDENRHMLINSETPDVSIHPLDDQQHASMPTKEEQEEREEPRNQEEDNSCESSIRGDTYDELDRRDHRRTSSSSRTEEIEKEDRHHRQYPSSSPTIFIPCTTAISSSHASTDVNSLPQVAARAVLPADFFDRKDQPRDGPMMEKEEEEERGDLVKDLLSSKETKRTDQVCVGSGDRGGQPQEKELSYENEEKKEDSSSLQPSPWSDSLDFLEAGEEKEEEEMRRGEAAFSSTGQGGDPNEGRDPEESKVMETSEQRPRESFEGKEEREEEEEEERDKEVAIEDVRENVDIRNRDQEMSLGIAEGEVALAIEKEEEIEKKRRDSLQGFGESFPYDVSPKTSDLSGSMKACVPDRVREEGKESFLEKEEKVLNRICDSDSVSSSTGNRHVYSYHDKAKEDIEQRGQGKRREEEEEEEEKLRRRQALEKEEVEKVVADRILQKSQEEKVLLIQLLQEKDEELKRLKELYDQEKKEKEDLLERLHAKETALSTVEETLRQREKEKWEVAKSLGELEELKIHLELSFKQKEVELNMKIDQLQTSIESLKAQHETDLLQREKKSRAEQETQQRLLEEVSMEKDALQEQAQLLTEKLKEREETIREYQEKEASEENHMKELSRLIFGELERLEDRFQTQRKETREEIKKRTEELELHAEAWRETWFLSFLLLACLPCMHTCETLRMVFFSLFNSHVGRNEEEGQGKEGLEKLKHRKNSEEHEKKKVFAPDRRNAENNIVEPLQEYLAAELQRYRGMMDAWEEERAQLRKCLEEQEARSAEDLRLLKSAAIADREDRERLLEANAELARHIHNLEYELNRFQDAKEHATYLQKLHAETNHQKLQTRILELETSLTEREREIDHLRIHVNQQVQSLRSLLLVNSHKQRDSSSCPAFPEPSLPSSSSAEFTDFSPFSQKDDVSSQVTPSLPSEGVENIILRSRFSSSSSSPGEGPLSDGEKSRIHLETSTGESPPTRRKDQLSSQERSRPSLKESESLHSERRNDLPKNVVFSDALKPLSSTTSASLSSSLQYTLNPSTAGGRSEKEKSDVGSSSVDIHRRGEDQEKHQGRIIPHRKSEEGPSSDRLFPTNQIVKQELLDRKNEVSQDVNMHFHEVYSKNEESDTVSRDHPRSSHENASHSSPLQSVLPARSPHHLDSRSLHDGEKTRTTHLPSSASSSPSLPPPTIASAAKAATTAAAAAAAAVARSAFFTGSSFFGIKQGEGTGSGGTAVGMMDVLLGEEGEGGGRTKTATATSLIDLQRHLQSQKQVRDKNRKTSSFTHERDEDTSSLGNQTQKGSCGTSSSSLVNHHSHQMTSSPQPLATPGRSYESPGVVPQDAERFRKISEGERAIMRGEGWKDLEGEEGDFFEFDEPIVGISSRSHVSPIDRRTSAVGKEGQGDRSRDSRHGSTTARVHSSKGKQDTSIHTGLRKEGLGMDEVTSSLSSSSSSVGEQNHQSLQCSTPSLSGVPGSQPMYVSPAADIPVSSSSSVFSNSRNQGTWNANTVDQPSSLKERTAGGVTSKWDHTLDDFDSIEVDPHKNTPHTILHSSPMTGKTTTENKTQEKEVTHAPLDHQASQVKRDSQAQSQKRLSSDSGELKNTGMDHRQHHDRRQVDMIGPRQNVGTGAALEKSKGAPNVVDRKSSPPSPQVGVTLQAKAIDVERKKSSFQSEVKKEPRKLVIGRPTWGSYGGGGDEGDESPPQDIDLEDFLNS
ncbi:non-specific serine threonine protein kinase [Cystoisospora suis]|uniref:Non-specific serine threonine protein kinase n=1 Tax=Cystoisospora suis TaxID=483139 RepID=A0A2C6LDY5_9APIC|nr:non-specific serine threonine protein kinase [Cystoisospora suis]